MQQPKVSKLSIILVFLFLTIQSAHAIDGVTLSVGGWTGDQPRVGGRIAVRWNWMDSLYQNQWFTISSFIEPSIGYWRALDTDPGDNRHLGMVTIAPVFHFAPNKPLRHVAIPFLELGIGAALMTKDDLGGRQFGSTYHFEDRVGTGLRFVGSPIEISYRFIHYSNASVERPNSGMNLHLISMTRFW